LLIITMFTILTVFGLMNVVIGVLVERALEAAEKFSQLGREAEMAKRMAMINEFQHLMDDIDSDKSGTLSKAEFLEALADSPSLKAVLTNLDFPTAFSVGEMFTLIDSSGDGVISSREFKNGMSRMVECSPFQSLCILLTSIHSLKSQVRELKATSLGHTINKAPHVSDLENKEVPSPHCLEKDWTAVRMELEDMKVDFTSRINNLLQLLSPGEALHQSSSTPVWVPLPTTSERLPTVSEGAKSLTSEGCASYGKGAAEVKNAAKQQLIENVPNIMDQSVTESATDASLLL